MIKYFVVNFYDRKENKIGKISSIIEPSDSKINALLKEHNANYATIETRVKWKQELNIKIA